MSSAKPIRRIILPLEMPRSSFVSFCGIIVSGGADTASGADGTVNNSEADGTVIAAGTEAAETVSLLSDGGTTGADGATTLFRTGWRLDARLEVGIGRQRAT